ncbi:MAG: PorV/PorQ family protein [Elusimicrobiales bacterium]
MKSYKNEGSAAWPRGALALALAAFCAVRLPAGAAMIHPDAGSTSAAFLKIGAGARAVSMAGAFTAIADDPYAFYWNPAGLANVRGAGLSFTHNEYFQALAQELLVYTVEGEKLRLAGPRALKKGTWALGLNYFHTPKDMERRSGLYESDPLYPISPVEGTFRAYDLAVSASYGFAYGRDASLGGSFKVISQTIDDESGTSAALDLGAMRTFNWLGGRLFTAGASVQNIGPGVKFVSRRYALPLTLRAGLSHRLPESGALLSFDVSKPLDNYPFFALGLEHSLTPKLALRAGYRLRMYGNELGAWSGFSAGMGLGLERFNFDYAFAPFGEIGNSHRFTVSFRFGEKAPPAPRSPRAAVLSAEKLQAARLHAYAVSARPLKISPAGVQYQLDGVSPASPVRAVSMRVLARGPAPEVFNLADGELPEKLGVLLPAGYRPCASLQLVGAPGNIQGNLSVEFVLEGDCSGQEAGPELLYLAAGGWVAAAAEKLPEAGGERRYKAAVPPSSHYVIAVKR